MIAQVITVSDPQFMTGREPSMFHDQISYLIANNPDLVVFLGDTCDGPMGLGNCFYGTNWPFVTVELARLTSAGVKWALIPGNHDYTTILTKDSSELNAAVSIPSWLTPFSPGYIDNTWGLVTLAGRQWLYLGLEYGPRTAVVSQAAAIIAAHPGVPVLLATHAYLYWDGTRFDWITYGGAQQGNPNALAMTPGQGIYDGQALWSALVQPNSTVGLVLCGHTATSKASGITNRIKTDTRLDSSLCHQLMLNYQGYVPLGSEWMTTLVFDETNKLLSGSAYSPYFRYTTDQFVVTMP
jgi:Calcineurin-like phosphoesterase